MFRKIFISSILIAVFCAPAVVAQTPKSRKPSPKPPQSAQSSEAAFNDLKTRAATAAAESRLEDALNLYRQALELRPKWAEGWWSMGTILYERDLYPAGRDAFRALVSLEPKHGPGWGMLGLCEFNTREYDRAVISLQRGRLLGLGGNAQLESVVRYHAALLYIRAEQFEFAFEILREFLREGNESPKVLEAFGLTMLRLPYLPTELPPDKREPVLIAGRAGFNMAARRRDEATKAFDELLTKYPAMPNVHYSHGVYLINHDADAALAEFHKELSISPEHVPAMLQIAFDLLKRAQYDDALPWAQKAAQKAPNLFPARNALGRILLELGQTDRAIHELEAGVKLAPDSPEMHYALARAYTRAGQKEKAAREREIFQRLDKMYREQREGAPETGEAGSDVKPPTKP